jgi:hypothetical protein
MRLAFVHKSDTPLALKSRPLLSHHPSPPENLDPTSSAFPPPELQAHLASKQQFVNMMFKATTIVALVAALVSTTQAAATGSKLDARQDERPCPVNGTACGWYLMNPGGNRHCT